MGGGEGKKNQRFSLLFSRKTAMIPRPKHSKEKKGKRDAATKIN